MPDSRRALLSPEALAAGLESLPDWSAEGGAVHAEFSFESYSSGVLFACALAHAADRMDHHPDLFIGWRKVKVGLSTHDAGGVTQLDLDLAAQASALAG
jgi:4a-hydroxytetrahydrobiopterin dehydratase